MYYNKKNIKSHCNEFSFSDNDMTLTVRLLLHPLYHTVATRSENADRKIQGKLDFARQCLNENLGRITLSTLLDFTVRLHGIVAVLSETGDFVELKLNPSQ